MALCHTLHDMVLVRDCLEADGGFLLLHLIKVALHREPVHDVVLVAAHHTAGHYALAARKAGLALPALQAQSRVAVVDVLALLTANPPEQQAGAALIDLVQLADHITCAAAGTAAAAGTSDSSRPLCLVIDDLSVLAGSSGDGPAWPAFLHSCRSLGTRLGRHFCLVVLIHGDIDADLPWVTRLAHLSATVVDVEPLESGRSSEVTGRVVVWRREPGGQASLTHLAAADRKGAASVPELPGPGEQLLYFKLSESGASFFPQLVRATV